MLKLIKIIVVLLFVQVSFAQNLLTLMEDELTLPIIANLQFDFDMNYATTASVADQSGNNRTMTFYDSPTVNIAGLNGLKTVTFDGNTEYGKIDAFTSNQPYTVYMVVKVETLADYKRLADGDGLNSALISLVGQPAWGIYAGTYLLSPAPTESLTTNWCIVTCVFNTTSSFLQLNDGVGNTGTAGTSNAGGFTLASAGNGTSNSNITVARVLRYAGAHDSATRTIIKNYLKKKYNL